MKMTRLEVVDLYKKLSSLPKKEYNRFFLYSIEKTKAELKPIIEIVAKKEYEIVYDEKIRQFENERISILEENSNKDETGKPIILDNRYDIPTEKSDSVREQTANLSKKYEDDFKRIDSLRTEFEIFLKEEVEVDIVKTSFKTIPETLDMDLFNTVMKLVKETDEEIQALIG